MKGEKMKKIEMVQFEEQNIQLYTQKGELLMTMEELAKAVVSHNAKRERF